MIPRRRSNHSSPLLSSLLAVALSAAAVQAQNTGTVRGEVTDAITGAPLRAAVVQILGTTRSALTNVEGSYTIAGVAVGEVELLASIIGYTTQLVTVAVAPGGIAEASFQLRQTALELGGLVVQATGERQARREIGNSVASISMEDIERAPVNNIQELLTGRTAGVTVRTSGGTTGVGNRIRIRGANSASLSNEPLLIVDGVQVTSRGGQFISTASAGQTAVRMNDLNPEDIETIEILRGPAASALYGTAAANGVIQVTTRRGRTGDTEWSYYTEVGQVEDHNDFPSNHRAFGTSPTGERVLCPLFGGTVNQAAGNCAPEDLETLNVLKDPRTTPFRSGRRTEYGANLSGGSGTTTFFVSADVEREDGVYVSNTLDRTGVRANLRSEVRDGLTLSATSGFVSTRLTLPQNDNNAFSFILNGVLGATSFDDGDEVSSAYRVGLGPDVIATRRETSETDRFTGTLNMSWQALPWLSLSAITGVDYIGQHDHVLQEAGTGFTVFGSPFAEGFRTSHRFQSFVYSANASATANRNLSEDVRSTTTVGASFLHSLFRRTAAFGAGLLGGTESLQGTSSLFAVEEQNSEGVTVGGLIRQQISFRERLFVAASLRGDDDSALGAATDLALYPSVSASWVIGEEDFFPDIPGVSSLRLRTAWGQSGLRPGTGAAESFFSSVSVRVQGTETTGVTVSSTGNPDLEVERIQEIEGGFDMGLLEERYGVELTIYRKVSADALVSRRLAPSLGLTGSQLVNLAAVTNSGAELVLRGTLVDHPLGQLDLTASGSWNKNVLDRLGEDVDDIIFGLSGDTQRHTEGHALGAYFQRRILGYTDANDNGIIEPGEVELSEEAEFIGNPLPSRQISVAPELAVIDGLVRIAALFEHQGGHHVYNATDDSRCALSVSFFRCTSNFDPDTPRDIQARNAAVFQAGSFAGFIEPGDFWKLREVTLTLVAPDAWLQRAGIGIESARLSLSGRNLATWSDYSGIDPEVSFTGHGSNHTSADYFTQPALRYLTARLAIVF